MSDNNPYAPPRAEVRDRQAAGRPVWVWVICIFYLFGAISTAASLAFVYSGSASLSEQQRQYFASLSIVDHVLTLLVLGINTTAAVLLFRLRKLAATLFPTGFAIGLLHTAWQAAAKGWYAAIAGGFAGVMFGWVIAVLVCLYAWRLAKTGVLK